MPAKAASRFLFDQLAGIAKEAVILTRNGPARGALPRMAILAAHAKLFSAARVLAGV